MGGQILMVLVLLTLLAGDPSLKAIFVKAGPNPFVVGRSEGQTRAVVLIHGLGLHPFLRERVVRATPRPWQHSSSSLVQTLAKTADVYAFAYSQTVPMEKVAEEAVLARSIARLKADGYREIILVGHSAGGVIARQLVEDQPECGVTRVIQVNAPNGGSGWATINLTREVQTAFFGSLSVASRERVLLSRHDKVLPRGIEFACIVGSLRVGGDGIVSCLSQWPTDLQKQGVPAYVFHGGHRDAVVTSRGVELIAKLVNEPMPRWDADKVAQLRKSLIGK